MQVDVMIVGQGICGTFLSWYLEKAGISFIVLDESNPCSASKAAAGLINPITGRRLVKTWMIDDLIPFVKEEYGMIGKELEIDCLSEMSIVDFFSTPQMRNAFLHRLNEDPSNLRLPDDESVWNPFFRSDFGFGCIEPCWLVDLNKLLARYRQKLINEQKLLEGRFNYLQLTKEENGIRYKTFRAERIIFCDGIEGFTNPYFKDLPFSPNKGEALILEIPQLPVGKIFKKGMILVPWGEGLFWVGSSYAWSFDNVHPSPEFKERTSMLLNGWLRGPFKIVEHLASIRPAVLERRPFVGFHPIFQNIGILNGMGTKGCSLAPFFAKQLTQYLVSRDPIMPEVNISRFNKLLSKPQGGLTS
jgi:glycine/D-amino acid oxidase-like deaminating enzyme